MGADNYKKKQLKLLPKSTIINTSNNIEEDSEKESSKLHGKLRNLFSGIESVEQSNFLLQKLVDINNPHGDSDLTELYHNTELLIETEVELSSAKSISSKVQKIAGWFVYFQKALQFFYLMKCYQVNPFIVEGHKGNALHICCTENMHEFLRLLLTPNYKYSDGSKEFNLSEGVMSVMHFSRNTAAHLCCIWNNWECLEILIDACKQLESAEQNSKKKSQKNFFSMERTNFRGWTASDLNNSSKKFPRSLRHAKKHRDLLECLKTDPPNSLTCSQNKLELYDSAYTYCIIAKADSEDPKKTTIYRQLEHIQNNWRLKGSFQIQIVESHFNSTIDADLEYNRSYLKKVEKNNYFYLVRADHRLVFTVAKLLQLKIYDHRKEYFTSCKKIYRKNYEPFRDIQKQQTMIYLLTNEFNLFRYHQQGMVISHFPIHHFKARNRIETYWTRYRFWLMLNILTPGYKPQYNTPITKIALYCGIQHGFYFGFLITYTSWLCPLALIGLALFIWSFISNEAGSNDGNNLGRSNLKGTRVEMTFRCL